MCHHFAAQSYFNPRSREGSDVFLQPSSCWGRYFNPRSREGSDQSDQPSAFLHPVFQSTLPRGERPGCVVYHKNSNRDFNPRSREGSDQKGIRGECLQPDFNPRSREGSDLLLGRDMQLSRPISIHAPARGATFTPDVWTGRQLGISIHAPARGATIQILFAYIEHNDFNPRSREGSDSDLLNIPVPL